MVINFEVDLRDEVFVTETNPFRKDVPGLLTSETAGSSWWFYSLIFGLNLDEHVSAGHVHPGPYSQRCRARCRTKSK